MALKLKPAAEQIVLRLLRFGPQQSSRDLAAATGLARASVQTWLDRLNAQGILRTLRGRGTQADTHELCFVEASGPISEPLAETGPISEPVTNKERARANLHSLSNNQIVSEGSGNVDGPDGPEVRPQPGRPDPAGEEIVAAVEACFERPLDDWLADQFRMFPRLFRIPALAITEWIIGKCKEKQVRREPDKEFTPGALWKFATEWRELSKWYTPSRAREYEARRAVLDEAEPPPKKPAVSEPLASPLPYVRSVGAGG